MSPEMIEELRELQKENAPEFVAEAVKTFLDHSGAETFFIEPARPWENGDIESFNARMRDELLNGELFLNLTELK